MKNIQKITLLIILAGSFLTPAMAQNPQANRAHMGHGGQGMEKLQSAKIAFITQRVELTPKEAEKFWPIYHQYQKEMQGLAKERMAERKAESQTPADERLDDRLEMESRMLELRKKYTREFSRVISSEKVLRLYDAEKEFRRELLKRLQERRKQN